MDRRKILLVAAAVVAVLGTALVFLYVRGADKRAEERFETVEVLRGRAADRCRARASTTPPPAASSRSSRSPQDDLLPNAQTTIDALSGQVAITTIYPGEQIVPDKFGGARPRPTSPLQIPKGMIAISVNLTDPGRVAGFVNPGSEVGDLPQRRPTPHDRQAYSRLLLPGSRCSVSARPRRHDDDHRPRRRQQTRSSCRARCSRSPSTRTDAQKVLLAPENGELAFALLTRTARVVKTGRPAPTAAQPLQVR